MGKAVPKGIKSKALLLLKEFPEKFSSDFENNKKAIVEFGKIFSKTNRNLIVGFMSRKVKQKEIKERAKAAARKAEEKKTEEKTETKK